MDSCEFCQRTRGSVKRHEIHCHQVHVRRLFFVVIRRRDGPARAAPARTPSLNSQVATYWQLFRRNYINANIRNLDLTLLLKNFTV